MGVAYRGGLVAAATATLIYACRDRRMVPLTPDENHGGVHRSDGDRSCSGARPGRPPVVEHREAVRRRCRVGPGGAGAHGR